MHADEALCIHADARDADYLYATGFSVTDPLLWFRKGWRSYLAVPELELGRARATARVTHVIDLKRVERRLQKEIGRRPETREVLVEILRSKGIRRVTVPERFPLATAESCRASGIAVAVRSDPFFPERVAKRPHELAAIRTAQEATEAALEAALEVLRAARRRKGFLYHGGGKVTAESLKAVVDVELMRRGCIARNTIVACGEHGVDPHDTGSGPVLPDTPIIFDIFPRHATSGYYADMTRTVVRGKATRAVRDIYETVHAGQQYAFDRIHGGADAQAIHRGIQGLFADAGYATGPVNGRMQGYFHGTGHGVGLDIHELPTFGTRPDTLPEGAVVTVEPGLYYPGIGGVRLEDMVLVTREGCENLTHFPKQLEL